VAEHCEGSKAVESALAAKQRMQSKPKSKYCTNCKRTNHATNKCWEEGGRNHANSLAWIKKGDVDKSKKKTNKDKVYISKDDSRSEAATTAIDSTEVRWTNAHYLPLSARLEDGYMSYVTQELMKEKVSIAWNQTTTHSLIIEETAAASSINSPICFDTGATSHISLFRSDFVNISPIEPKQIRGMNGMSIPAIRNGVIKVRCGKGRKFTLNYALYAPQAALCLISVSKLGNEGCRITFDALHCQVLRNNKVLAEGIREGKHLYHLQCDTSHFEHAAIARNVPNCHDPFPKLSLTQPL